MRTFVLSLIMSLGFLLFSIRAIRQHRIKEHTAILWLAVSASMVLLSISLPLHALDRLSRLIGVALPSNLVLLLAVLFLVMLVFRLSISTAQLTERTTALAQEIGILSARGPSIQPQPEVSTVGGDDPSDTSTEPESSADRRTSQ